MRKLLLGLGAVVMVLSGVAMVSAYEAHVVNVTAHVEEAMSVDTETVHFGTSFPQEWRTRDFNIGTSTSFCNGNQGRVDEIDYDIYVALKPDGAEGYYEWLGDCLYIGIDATNKWPTTGTPAGDLVPVGTTVPTPTSAILVTSGKISKGPIAPWDMGDVITVGLEVPVFEGFYNFLTDTGPNPSKRTVPPVILTGSRNVPGGIELGAELKI